MKNLSALFVLLILLCQAACITIYGKIKVENDTYRHTKTLLLRQSFSVRGNDNGVNGVENTYVREVSASGAEKITAYLFARKSTSTFDLKTEAFIKIDEQTFPLLLENPQSTLRSETTSRTETQTVMDTSGTHTIQYVAGVSTEEWKEDRLTFSFTPEQIAALKQCHFLEFRLYAGPYPVTFKPNERELGRLKELLTMPIPE